MGRQDVLNRHRYKFQWKMLNSNNEALATSLYLISFMLSESSFQGDNTLHTFYSFITTY